ncbi:MAG TPA: riboflavin synthase [Chitinophagales bacterium]|nr:riboflavin synthase [Chitinophagales bacterium]HRP39573.1 riboflavin synthase [Chitinophagales bacterium]
MFTGIIEATGKVEKLETESGNLHITVSSPISHELKIDQSISHNGVCLTVVACNAQQHTVTAIAETLRKTNLGELNIGDIVNLERCMVLNSRLDGHIVQGHVDQTAKCINIVEENGSWIFQFEYEPSPQNLVVEKGSVCINGISLTAFDVLDDVFKVAIIPYTFEHTNMKYLSEESFVNIEFDIIGKYVARLREFEVKH